MGKYLLSVMLLLVSAAACTPAVKHPPISLRYMEKASKEEVFNQALFGVNLVAGGVDRSTNMAEGYIRSIPFKPKIEYKRPTLHYITVQIEKQTDLRTKKSYYLPFFRLRAHQATDLKTSNWKEINPPDAYRSFIETSMQKRVVALISGTLHEILPEKHYLGCIIVRDKEPLYTSPDKKQLLLRAGRYEFAELQFRGFKPLTVYRNGLLQIKFWLQGGEKRVCWVDENAVVVFMFIGPLIAGTAEVWKEEYIGLFIKAVTRNIGIHKGGLQKWSRSVMQAIIAGKVIMGMTEEQAVAAVGPPKKIEIKSGPRGADLKIYIYTDGSGETKRITFFEGKVIRILGF